MTNCDEYELEKFLRKCELQWRAKHKPNGEQLDWLAPHCNSVQEIASYLREIGFRVKKIMDEITKNGEEFRWVETTDGIIVYVNGDYLKGLYARSSTYGK